MSKNITNKEVFLDAILSGSTSNLPDPKTREEQYLKAIAEKGIGSSGTIDANSAYEAAVENGYTGTFAEWISSIGGINGKDGKSAYQAAREHGYNGTEEQFGTLLATVATAASQTVTNIDFGSEVVANAN